MNKPLGFAAAAFALDRATKCWAEYALQQKTGAAMGLPGLFQLRYAQNTGAAFSMFSNGATVLSVVNALLLLLALGYYLRCRARMSALAQYGLLSIFFGGVSNLLDRLLYGYVIDFIEPLFVQFAIFNIADAMICVGAVLFALSILWPCAKEASKYDTNR